MQPHILLIDDEKEILDLLQQSLGMYGYRVSTASSAEAARRVVQSDPPSLIISDLQLEETDGLELVDELRLKVPNVPVLLLTGVVFDADVVRDTIQKRVSSYLDKTTSLEGIVNELRRLLGNTAP
jgi:DNA-binding NtrC family response regulator